MKNKKLLIFMFNSSKKLFSLYLSFHLVFYPLLANPNIIVDSTHPNSTPSLDQAQNGVDIINIANPNQVGISNNLYLELNVDQKGAIFNNSTSAVTNTALGGLIAGNKNLTHSASLILNQVTSTSSSNLLGLMEVAGSKASLLIANPNGIICNGCGFINVNEATLTTGVISYQDLNQMSKTSNNPNAQLLNELNIRVQKGHINIDSLNALGSQTLNLLSHSLKIDGELYANTLKMIVGSNEFSLSDKGALLLWQPISTQNQGSLALDVSYLGRVYANSIYLVASEKDSIVKNAGVLATLPSQKQGDGGFYIDINGELKIARSTSQETQEEIMPQGNFIPSISSFASLILKAKSLENEGIFASEESASLEVSNLSNSFIILSKELLEISSSNIENIQGLIQGNDLKITTDTLSNQKGFILAKNDMDLNVKEIENKAEVILDLEEKHTYESFMEGKVWKTKGEIFRGYYEEKLKEYIPSLIYAGNNLTLNAEILNNYDGQVLAENENHIETKVLNNHLTRAKLRETYKRTEKCGWLYKKTCIHSSYDRSYSKKIDLPLTSDNLALAPSLEDFNPYMDYIPPTLSSLELTPQNIADFITGEYFKERFISLSKQSQRDFFATLGVQGIQSFVSSLPQAQQDLLFKRFADDELFLEALASTSSNQASLQKILEYSQNFNSALDEAIQAQLAQSRDLSTYQAFGNTKLFSTSSLLGSIGGKNIAINTVKLNNDGSIVASKTIFAQTKDKLTNKGVIKGENIVLNSDGDISNIGGKLEAKNDLTLRAKEVSIVSEIDSFDLYAPKSYFANLFKPKKVLAYQSDKLISSSALSGNNISITSANGVDISGASLHAQNNLSINAKEINISAEKLQQKNFLGERKTSNTQLLSSNILGNNISLYASSSITSTASKIKSNNNLNLSAESVLLLADKEEKSFSSSSRTWYGKSSSVSSYSSKEIGNSLEATNLTIVASKDIISVGSSMQAKEEIYISANSFTSLALKNTSSFSSSTTSSTLFGGSSSSALASSSTTHTLSSFEAKNIAIHTNKNTSLIGANLQAQENININAGEITIANVSDEVKLNSSSFKKHFWGLSQNKLSTQSREGITQSSNLNAKSINLNSSAISEHSLGNINIIGSNLTSIGSTNLNASGNVNILNAYNTRESESIQEDRNFDGLYMDFNRKFSAGARFKDNSKKERTSSKIAVASNLNSLGKIAITAKSNANIIGSNLSATQIDTQAKNITIASAQNVYTSSTQDKQGILKVGIEIGNSYVDAYYAGKDAYDAGKKVAQDTRALKEAQRAYREGKISKEALEDYKINLALSSASLLSAGTNLASSISGVASSIASSFGTGMYAGVSSSYEGNLTNSSSSSITQSSSTLLAKNITLNSQENIHQISSSLVADQINYLAGKDITLSAQGNTTTSNSQSSSYNISTSFGTKGWGGVSGGGGRGSSNFSSTEFVASTSLAHQINITAGNQTSLLGSTLSSDTISLKSKDLQITSLQDTLSSNSKNLNLNAGISLEGVSGGGGAQKQRQDYKWVNTQAGMSAKQTIKIDLDNQLTLKGGRIALHNTKQTSNQNPHSPSLSISAKSIEVSHLLNKQEQSSSGFNLSSSIGRNTSSLGIGLKGNTQIQLNKEGRIKEGKTLSSIGILFEDSLTSQTPSRATPPLTQEGTPQRDSLITLTLNHQSLSAQQREELGINSNLSSSEILTKDQITQALNASLNLDNHLLTQEGREQIINDFKDLGSNVEFIADSLLNENIVIQVTNNLMSNPSQGISSALQNYLEIYNNVENQITQDQKLNAKLNGLTNLNDEELQNTFQEVSNRIDEDKEGNQGRRVELYNNDNISKGYAYEDKKGKQSYIGINTKTNNLTQPKEVINTLYHETSNKTKHHRDEKNNQDAYATNRGNNAQSAYHFLNYGNKNTNTISSKQWNTKYANSTILKQGNINNTQAWINDQRGVGERDNAEVRRRPLSFDGQGRAEKIADVLHHEQIFFEDEKGGNIGFAALSGYGITSKVFGQFFTETDPSVIAKYRPTDGKHYDDAIMRRAVKDARRSGNFLYYKAIGVNRNNCQDFTREVKMRYWEILKQEGGKR